MRPVTTGAIRSTQAAYWAPLGWSPSSRDERPVVGGAERQVEDVDVRDRRARAASRAIVAFAATIAVVLPARIAVVGAGRGDGVVRDRDGHDAVRGQARQERVEDPLDVRRVRRGRHALDDVVDADQDVTNSGRRPSRAGSSSRIRSAEV